MHGRQLQLTVSSSLLSSSLFTSWSSTCDSVVSRGEGGEGRDPRRKYIPTGLRLTTSIDMFGLIAYICGPQQAKNALGFSACSSAGLTYGGGTLCLNFAAGMC